MKIYTSMKFFSLFSKACLIFVSLVIYSILGGKFSVILYILLPPVDVYGWFYNGHLVRVI